MEELETPTTTTTADHNGLDLQHSINGDTAFFHDANNFSDIDSSCSTPYVSAPSSPGRGPSPSFRYFYSAPSSPMHFLLASSPTSPSYVSDASVSGSSEFDFSARFLPTCSASAGAMSSADELFLNGQIRPMKLHHPQRPPLLATLIDEDEDEIDCDNSANEAEIAARGRDMKLRDRSIRRTRSMSPMRSTSLEWYRSDEPIENEKKDLSLEGVESKQHEPGMEEEEEATLPESASASRSSSAGRSSKRWVFLKDFLYRSKSEGRNNGHKFWSSISFAPVKDRKLSTTQPTSSSESINSSTATTSSMPATEPQKKAKQNARGPNKKPVAGKMMNGVGKKRVPPSAHELHYTTKRAQAEEMKKKTYLPYRQGLFGCLGFSSKSYGAMNGFARAMNPVSSR